MIGAATNSASLPSGRHAAARCKQRNLTAGPSPRHISWSHISSIRHRHHKRLTNRHPPPLILEKYLSPCYNTRKGGISLDIRVLKYFLAVARTESITRAAEELHMSQPPLSRQMKDLEEELGKQLLVRGSRRVTLTEEGMILRRRAEEIISLMEKAQSEISCACDDINGWICVGGGETDGMRLIAGALKSLRDEYPNVMIHLYSGNGGDVKEQLERDMLDFALIAGQIDLKGYDFIRLPTVDRWGVLMRRDHPLADKEVIRTEDLAGVPLLRSAQDLVENEISGWMGTNQSQLNIIGEYNLLYNAALLVAAGVGCALCLDRLIKTTAEEGLCFRPLAPELQVQQVLIWKKNKVLSKAAKKFLERLEGAQQGG